MKTLLGILESTQNLQNSAFEFLTENEMQIIRGGTEPIKPTSRPRDVFDEEDN